MKKSWMWILGIVLVIAIVAGSYYFNQQKNDTIKIGGLFALTGKWAVGGVTEANFAKMAINEINSQGGINGKKIEFILEDDMCSAKDAVTATNKLINEQGIKIILGPSCTPASAAVVPISSENEVIIFAATTTTNGLFDKYNYAFRSSPPSTQPAKKIADLAINKYDLKRIAIITEQTEFAESWVNDFSIEYVSLGGVVILTEKFTTGTTDFKSILLKINTKDIDAVYISTQAPIDAGIIIKQMAELGLTEKLQIIGNPTTIDLPVYESSGKKLPPTAFTVVAYSENQELLDNYRELYNEEPGFQFFYTAAVYDSVYILKDALIKCGEDNSCINDYLKSSMEWKGKVADWHFNENGDPILSDNSFIELKIINGTKIFG